jgi:hypothetical protein
MLQRIREIANPFHRRWFFAAPHLATILIVAGIAVAAFALGRESERQFGAQYFATHYDAPLPVITQTIQIPRVSAPQTLPAKTSIQTRFIPAAGDQQLLGSCAAFATAWVLSTEYRMQHAGSLVRFSPRCMYDHYAIAYSNGQDLGSWPPFDAETIPTEGIARYRQVPYPPYQIDQIYPAACRNTTYKMPVRFLTLGQGEHEGQAAVDAIKQQHTLGNPVLIALNVFPEFYSVVVQPLIVSPPIGPDGKPTEQSAGGHEVFVIATDDTKRFPDGSLGGAEFQNSWSRDYGNNGRAWLSYDFIRQYVYSVMVALIGKDAQTPAAGPHGYYPPQGKKHDLPPLPPGTGKPHAGYWAHHVRTNDTHADITRLVNQTGKRYHVWPLGLVALLATESGINQYSDRYGTWPDVSHGIAQFIDLTAIGQGVCADDYSCKVWLEVPANSIDLAGQFLVQLRRQSCERFPNLYAAYNQGGGYGCHSWRYHTPPPGYAAQAYASYLRNLSIVRVRYG